MTQVFLDNKQFGLVGEVLKERLQQDSKLSVAAPYMTLYAFREMQDAFKRVNDFRFLYTEPAFVENQTKAVQARESLIYGVNDEQKYKVQLEQASVARDFAEWLRKKAEVRSVNKQSNIEGSLFHIESKGEKVSIVGGSPFSANGLGYASSLSTYVNNLVVDGQANDEIQRFFDQLWNNKAKTQDVKDELLHRMELLYRDNAPEFIYFLTLYHVFKSFLEDGDNRSAIRAKTGFEDTIIWNKLYNFQRDGVTGAINKIEKFGGCIIADSVGLGKTFEALAVIKYYELRNYRVLVMAPKKLRENWVVYCLNDKRNSLAADRFSYDLLNHTDLSRDGGKSGDIDLEHINWGNYDLVVIDESHNFRNVPSVKDRESRYTRLMNRIIKAGVKTKVLMLSATPVNNRLSDLRNQIAFITEGNDQALRKTAKIRSIGSTLEVAQKAFKAWVELPEDVRTADRLLDMLNWDYFNLLDSLTIARSRKHIEKYYNIQDNGKFPTRLKPKNIKEEIDLLGEFPEFKVINREILRLSLAVYKPINYLMPHKVEDYNEKYDTVLKQGKGKFKQSDRENILVNLMKVNILKRLESSVHSFALTLGNIIGKMDGVIAKIDSYKPNDAVDMNLLDEADDPELEDFLVGSKVKVLLADMDLIRWKEHLQADKEILANLLDQSIKVTVSRDRKLLALKNEIKNKVNNPINSGNKKVIVFTAFADTAIYLYEDIHAWAKKELGLHTAVVTGGSDPKTTLRMKKTDFNGILLNFSPLSKEREKVLPEMKEEIDILIATDCISEGQNLQDCDYLVNYDIHWNPVRIIQRFGRIDRLGSRNDSIQLVNFWPSLELNEYINLEARVKSRMVLLDISATGEENVIEASEQMKDLEYRRRQLEQLQSEVLNLEDIAGSISITDFTLDDFKMDLLNYLQHHETALTQSPTGLFALTQNDNPTLAEEIKPGVIFCLRKLNAEEEQEIKNSLYPYFLVYVSADGEIIHSYHHIKKTLDIFRATATNKKEALSGLVKEFHKETSGAKRMEVYQELLTKAVQDINGKAEQEETMNLFRLGGLSSFMSKQSREVEDFEIVSYLILR